ncbi:hypothetical protein EMIT0P395_20159 [Pseudomonas sp. IT-P395]
MPQAKAQSLDQILCFLLHERLALEYLAHLVSLDVVGLKMSAVLCPPFLREGHESFP